MLIKVLFHSFIIPFKYILQMVLMDWSYIVWKKWAEMISCVTLWRMYQSVAKQAPIADQLIMKRVWMRVQYHFYFCQNSSLQHHCQRIIFPPSTWVACLSIPLSLLPTTTNSSENIWRWQVSLQLLKSAVWRVEGGRERGRERRRKRRGVIIDKSNEWFP